MAEWFARYPNDFGEYEITFRGTYTQAKKVEELCHKIIDKSRCKEFTDKDEIVFGELVLRSGYRYHIMAGKTRASVEERINREDGFLKLFPTANYYPHGDGCIELPHIKIKDKIIFTCGHMNSDSWKILRGMMKVGVSIIYDPALCDRHFYQELSTRILDLTITAE